MRVISKKEHEQNAKELIQFCKDNHCDMYNHMMNIQSIRKKAIEDFKTKETKKIRGF